MILDGQGRYARDAAVDEIGVVCISGPTAFKGYVEEQHNKGLWVKPGWFSTGDMGRMDQDGFFWLTGRMKELIIRGGHNIDPAAIEEPIYRYPDVRMVASVGRPDPHSGEVPVAYVELVEGSKVTSGEILNFARDHIGERAAVPKEIVIVDKIPLTSVGKIFKPALRWDAIKRVYAEELAALGNLALSVEISVGEDMSHGTSAAITIRPAPGISREALVQRIQEILARYTVTYSVDFLSE